MGVGEESRESEIRSESSVKERRASL